MCAAQMKQAKGQVILGYARFIKKKWGAEGLSECERDMGLKFSDIKDDTWYPEDYNSEIIHWIAEKKGLEMVFQAGISTVAQSGVIAFAAKIAGIRRVLERGEEDYYRALNFGGIKVEVGDKSARVALTGTTRDAIECLSWSGVFQGVINITGNKGSVRELQCTHKGADVCIFELTWK